MTRKWRPKTRPQDVKVGKYFRLSDFLYSETAVSLGVSNLPPSYDCPEIEGMKNLCTNILDPIVEHFGPVSITYGYVSPGLAKHIRRASALHRYQPDRGIIGGAADIATYNADSREVLRWVAANCEYDRLIAYPGSEIVCVAWTSRPRSHFKEWVYRDSGKPVYIDFGGSLPPISRQTQPASGQLSLLQVNS